MGRLLRFAQGLLEAHVFSAIPYVLLICLATFVFVDVSAVKHQGRESDVIRAHSVSDVDPECFAERIHDSRQVVVWSTLDQSLAGRSERHATDELRCVLTSDRVE